MMISWLIGFFSDYEVIATFVAALVGFGGVIITLIVQHQLDVKLENERIAADRRRVISALSAELIGVRSFCQGAINAMEGSEDLPVPKALPFFYFDALTSRVDLLEPEQVQALRHCYTWIRELPLRAEMLCAKDQSGSGAYVRVMPYRFGVVREWFTLLEKYADHALATLEAK